MAEQIDRLREGLTGQYEVDRAVGQGGMATVYLARDLRNERKVAIKLLSGKWRDVHPLMYATAAAFAAFFVFG